MIPSDLSNHPWYSDILYYLNHEKCPENLNSHQRRKLGLDSSKYVIVNNHLFRRSYDGLLLRCIDDHGTQGVLESMHRSPHDVLPSGVILQKIQPPIKFLDHAIIGRPFSMIYIFSFDLLIHVNGHLVNKISQSCL